MFVQLIRKVVKHIQTLRKSTIAETVPDVSGAAQFKGAAEGEWKPVEESVDAELKEAGDEVTKRLKEAQRQMIDDLDLAK